MKLTNRCPLWTYLPTAAMVTAVVAQFVRVWPLPPSVPVHFALGGRVDRWGGAWEMVTALGMLAGLIAMDIFFREKWARQELRKRFNGVAVFESAMTAVLATATIVWLDVAKQGLTQWPMPWWTPVIAGGAIATISATVEWLRPFRPMPEHLIVSEDTTDIETAIQQAIRDRRPWVYCDVQNPMYMSLLTLGMAAGFVLLAGLMVYLNMPATMTVLFLVIAIAGGIHYGGLRSRVTANGLDVRFGIVGLPALRLPVSRIASVEVQRFEPMGDFGGWGWRIGRPAWATLDGRRRYVRGVYCCGTEGVKIVRDDGRVWLIGSDRPHRLAAAIRAAMGEKSSTNP